MKITSILDTITADWGADFEAILIEWMDADATHPWSKCVGFFCYQEGYTT